MLRRGGRRVLVVRSQCVAQRRCFGEQDVQSSAAIRPSQQGVLRAHIEKSTAEAAWGPSEPNPIANPAAALRFWLQCGFDPLLSLPGSNEVRAVEDAWGTDLSSTDLNVVKESYAFWSAHYKEKWLRTLRLSRRSGASQIGLLRDTPTQEDEADQATTAWGDDLEFTRLYLKLREVVPERPANLEQLEMVVRRAQPEQFAKIVNVLVAQGTPHSYAPIPTNASFHYSDAEAITKWATKFQEARNATDSTRAALRDVVDRRGWPAFINALADKLQRMNAIRAQRLERQLKAGLKAQWTTLTPADKLVWATEEANRVARGLMDAELDVEEKGDTTEQWIEEHEAICKIGDESIDNAPAGLTFKKVWVATACLEALEFEHLYSTSQFRHVHAQAMKRLLEEHSFSDIAAAEEVALRNSTFDTRSEDLVPSPAPKHSPAAYLQAQWWRFCGPGVVTQHTENGSRQLLHSHQHIAAAPAMMALHYSLRPLSSRIDYSTPFKHRQSLLRILTDFSLDTDRVLTGTTNDVLRSLHAVEDTLGEIKAAIAWPLGVARRAKNGVARARNEQSDHPLLNVQIKSPEAGSAQVAERAKYGVTDPSTWLLGSTRKVTYDWAAITKLPPAVHANQAAQALERLHQKRSVGLEVTLWKKVTAGPTPRSVAEETRLQNVIKAIAGSPSLAAVARHMAWETSRVAGTSAAVPTAPVAEANDDGYEFVTVLDDNHQGEFDGTLSVTIPHLRNSMGNEPGEPITKGVYRLRVRGFQHAINPDHHPSRASQAYSTDFAVDDILPAALTAFGATPQGTLPADKFMNFFDSLRTVGLAINTGLEFEAGQSLTVDGDALVTKIVQLISNGHFAPLGARAGISAAENAIEAQVRDHWLLHHPGATDDEWQSVRRFVLARAMRTEQDWWTVDENLNATLPFDVAHQAEQRIRYGLDIAASLQAEGQAGAFTVTGSIAPRPAVAVAYTGNGTVASLAIDRDACGAESLDRVLALCTEAIDSAHMRHCTLSAQRLNNLERGIRYHVLDAKHGLDIGGIHGRTIRYAYDKAATNLEWKP